MTTQNDAPILPLPPFPGPDVTDITVEQERQNIVTAALKKAFVASIESDIAAMELKALRPTRAELRTAALP